MTVMLGAELHSIASLIRDQRYDTSLIGREDAHKMGVFPASFYVLELRRIPETGPKFGGFGPAAFPVILALALRCFVASVLSSIFAGRYGIRIIRTELCRACSYKVLSVG